MRSLWLPVLLLGLAQTPPALAQIGSPKAAGPVVSNPVVVPPSGVDAVLAGQPVSQPLQPVEIPESVEAAPADAGAVIDANVPTARPPTGLGDSWDSLNYLIWWPKAQPVPVLATANRGGSLVLGQPGTRILIGGGEADGQDLSGGRFVIGRSISPTNVVGIEGVYFFLGTRTLTARTGDPANPRLGNVGLPYFDPVAGGPDVLTVGRPGFSRAVVAVSTSTRVEGAEFNVVASLLDRPEFHVNALTGYRFFQVHEGLRQETTIVTPARPDQPVAGRAGIADQFDAHTRFSGWQFGIAADASRGALFAELTGKIALGRSYEVVRVSGQTNTLIGTGLQAFAASYPSAVYAQPTNSGRTAHSAFAVLPETLVKVGVRYGPRGRFYCGYNFLYLSDAVRPGDQIDGVVNPAQIRLLNPAGSAAGPDRPGPLLNRSDFWVQGLVVGLEGRY